MMEKLLEIRTPDGTIDALLTRPASPVPLPAIINLTDGLGFRPAFADQAKRIAEHGYVVLTPNIFYRTSKLPVFAFAPDFADERTRTRFAELKAPLTPDAMSATARRTSISSPRSRSSRAVRWA
ncbi:MAG: dienelactone hydrolase family protein [Gemmatimonadota bacterium]|nr:dienelactone hydrolase family protein [Gemmatimonadota bacterium]